MGIGSSKLASALRMGHARRPDERGHARSPEGLILYEFEGCPFCRRVREAVTDLDLEITIRPCPKGGTRFRPEAFRVGGKAQFPLLVDPTLRAPLYESLDIVGHLYRTYGEREPPSWLAGRGAFATLQLASIARLGGDGTSAKPSEPPSAPLHFMGTEGNPAARLVRERLCSLELEYLRLPLGDHDPERVWLRDTSTGTEVEGWESIVEHLNRTYAASA